MKKILCLLLCAALFLSCAGCGKAPGAETTAGSTTQASTTNAATDAATQPPETTAPEQTPPEAIQLPLSSIFMPLVTEVVTADDGTVLFSTTYQDVTLTMPDAENADSIIMDLLHRIDANHQDDEQLLSWAREDYTGQEGWIPYYSEITYAPARMDEKVLSLYGRAVSYGGGVHSNYTCISANYDLATGKALRLPDVLIDEAAALTLCEAIIQGLGELEDEYYLYDGYERTVNERYGTVFDTTWEPTDAWYLSDSGLCIYFSPYDIAPYASGDIQLTIPYEALSEIMKPDFLPASLPAAVPGVIEGDLAQDLDLDNFSQFAEAIVDPNGERVLLHTEGLVTNVTIETGSWTADGLAYIPQATIFSSSTLTPGDAIMLQASFPVMPQLRLRYTAGGTEYRFFITQSGMDGSIILLDDLT